MRTFVRFSRFFNSRPFQSKLMRTPHQRKALLWILSASCIALQAYPVHAADIPTYTPAVEADPATFDKPPIKFGSFLLFSELTVQEYFDDNLFAAKTDKDSDFITRINPKAQLVKSFGRHEFSLDLSATGDFHKEFDDENRTDYSAALNANLEAYRALHIPISISHTLEHLMREDTSQLGITTRSPVGVFTDTLSAGLNYQPNRLSLGLIGTYSQKRIPDADTVLPTSGTIIAKDRDKDSYKLELTSSYETHTNWRPLLKLQYIDDRYLHRTLTATGFDGAERDSTTYRGLAGMGFDYKKLITSSLLLGQEYRKYKDPTAQNVSGFSAEATLGLAPTERTKIAASFHRMSNDDNILLAGMRQSILSLTLDQELTSRWSAQLSGQYKNTDLLNQNRTDDDYKAGLSVVYAIQKGLLLQGSYAYSLRDSSLDTASYDKNVFMLGLRKQF
jgi:hypothetical protein